jgi:tripartite-type tricarboxylate transporter receptor subunit TctC
MKNGKLRRWLVCSVTFAAFVALPFYVLARAQVSADSPFAGQRVHILVGTPPGGGHDIEARVFARHLGKHLPGNPSVIVQNMPGAGTALMITHVYRRAKPDGLSFGIASGGGIVFRSAIEKVEFDVSRMPIIWAVRGTIVDLVRDTLGVKSAKELLEVDPSRIVIAGRSPRDGSCIAGKLAMDLLGINGYKSVCAYPGTGPIRLAMERDEANFFVGADHHLMPGGPFAEMADKGLVLPIWQSGYITPEGKIERSPTMPEVPTFYEVYQQIHGKPPAGVVWEAYKAASLDYGMMLRSYVLPPETPADRIAMLRQAIDRMAGDPEFVEEWQKHMMPSLEAVRVPVKTMESLRSEFLKPAQWQEFLQRFIKE